MGPGASLDNHHKKFSIIYGNVKSYDLLFRDLYRADQREESVTSYATWVEGLLSQITAKFPDQIPLEKEQELLIDRLLHDSCKNIWDSVKYHHADAKVDYMTFLE